MTKRTMALLDAYRKGYHVDKDGNAFSPSGRQLKVWIHSKTRSIYYVFSINLNGKVYKVFVSRLQALQKFGDELFKEGIEVRHLNNNSLDNSWDNIIIGTHQENMMDIPRELRLKFSEAACSKTRKLTKENVVELRRDRQNGATQRILAEKYNVSKSTVSLIVNRKTYMYQLEY